ncbi:hypothetical protein [Belliella baltica]|nr:hypothetical protein [Belliella baltica]
MKTVNLLKDLNKRKTPIVKIDTSLNHFDGNVIASGKLDKANKALETLGLPK